MIKQEEEIVDDYKWEMSRKEFIHSLLIVGAVSQIPFFSSCETKDELRIFNSAPLSKSQLQVLQSVQLILFPKEGSGPSALEVNADKWIVYVLNDDREPQREKDFIIDHIDGLIEFTQNKLKTNFDLLSREKQQQLLEKYFEDKTHRRWGSRLLTLIFEALLLDPIYGVNPDEIGWKWLKHNPGMPRPTERTKYPTIYTTLNEI